MKFLDEAPRGLPFIYGFPHIWYRHDCATIGHLWFFNTITHEGVKYLWKKCSRCHQVRDAQPLVDHDE